MSEKKMVRRNVALVWGIIIGIIGVMILFGAFALNIVAYLYYSEYDVEQFGYVRWGDYYFFASAILLGVAFALGATAIIFFRERRRAYFMLLATIIGALGFAPHILEAYASGPNALAMYSILGFAVWAIVTAVLMLISAILLLVSTQ